MSFGPYYRDEGDTEHDIHNAEYRWSYEDYEEATRIRHPKRRGLFALLGCTLLVMLALAVLGLSIYGAYSLTNGELIEENKKEEMPSTESDFELIDPESPKKKREPGKMLTIIDPPGDDDEGLSTVDIAIKVKPSVVGITVYKTMDSYTPSSYGSGIVMSDDGYIITNHHVIDGALGISVEFENGDTFEAEMVGSDERTDLAVISIDAEGLTPAEFGNSDELLPGERIVAIGNPGGSSLAGTVTQGIVSAVNRNISNGTYATSYIQTDAAINPGNSGGALINVYGQVVGINTSKIMSVSYEGIGFAIPINEAKPIIDSLIACGDVLGRTKIGITGQTIDEAAAKLNRVPVGIYIRSIEEESPLVGTGASVGDILTEIDGEGVDSFAAIGGILKNKSPGDEVTLTLYRPGKTVDKDGYSFEVTISLIEDLS